MKKVEILEGGIYANESGVFAREVLSIEGKDVSYRDFCLPDGELMSSWRRCRLSVFRAFAARTCTPGEISRLQRDKPSRQYLAFAELAPGLIRSALECVPDTELVAEVRRRKLSVK